MNITEGPKVLKMESEEKDNSDEVVSLPPTSFQEGAASILTDKEIDSILNRVEEQLKSDQKIEETRRKLGVDPYSTGEEISGNYQGDWTLLLRERIKNPVSKQKFIASRIGILKGDAPYGRVVGEAVDLTKKENTKKYYYDQIRNYDSNIDEAFSYTTYVPAKEHGKNPEALGDNKEGGTVFNDASHGGSPLTNEDKNLIEAHEKGHVIRDFKINFADISKAFDFSRIPQDVKRPMYLKNPDELIERMSQLKNYFGFKGGEIFTIQHLKYAQEKYLKDGRLDNDMTDFFAMITPEKEEEFLRVINTYPV